MSSQLLLHGPTNCIVCGELYEDCSCSDPDALRAYYSLDELDGVEVDKAEQERLFWEQDLCHGSVYNYPTHEEDLYPDTGFGD